MAVSKLKPVVLHPTTEHQPIDARTVISRFDWYYKPVKRWAWLIVVVAIVAGGATYLFQDRVVKPYYQAAATLEIDVPTVATGNADGISIADSQQYAPTAASLVHSETVAAAALRQLKSSASTAVPAATAKILAKMKNPADLLSVYTAAAQADSQDVEVTVTSQNPTFAVDAANVIAYTGQARESLFQNQRFAAMEASLQSQITGPKGYQRSIRYWRLYPSKNSARLIAGLYAQIATTRAAIDTEKLTSANSTIRLGVSSPANLPTSPVGPHPLRSGILAGALAALILMSGLVLREYFATTLRTPDEVSEAMGGAPTLGAILLSSSLRPSPGIIVSSAPRSQTAEGLRVIRTNLLFSNVDKPPRVILITSARQGEGKTTIGSNLAATMAELGGRVLLIDADLRRPTIHKLFAVPEKTGLTSALIASANEPLDTFIRPTEQHGLFVMPGGPLPPNPAEMLSSKRMRDLVSRLGSEYDTIILDSPPLLAVTDAAILSTMVDCVVLVTDVKSMTVQGATRITEALDRVGSQIGGVVLNKVTNDQRGSYYYNYYFRHEGGYAYGPAEAAGAKKEPVNRANPARQI